MKRAAILLLLLLSCTQTQQPRLNTYFTYTSEELQTLQDTTSKKEITTQEIVNWQNKAFELISQNKVPETTASKIYAYLAAAQYDFAQISHYRHGNYNGDITSISEATLCEFLPCIYQTKTDPYSQKTTQIIINKIKDRTLKDNIQTKTYNIQKGPDKWTGIEPYIGLDTGSWKTWNLQTGNQYSAPAPIPYGTPEFQQQIQKTKQALKYATPEQIITIVNWAGTPGTKTLPGKWLQIADEYIIENNIPIEQALIIKTQLATTIADSIIAAYDSKYTYWVKRPNQADPEIHTIIPTPNRPSYPASHATTSAATATILTYYLPENKEQWQKLANEATNSRIWGGTNYEMDNKAGFEQGIKIAQYAIK